MRYEGEGLKCERKSECCGSNFSAAWMGSNLSPLADIHLFNFRNVLRLLKIFSIGASPLILPRKISSQEISL